jgi:hypothetical protein
MSPTTGETCATEDMKMRKAGLMGLSFPYRCSILFHEVGALNLGRVLAERGALIFTRS